jgi:hypothetical protein
MCTAYASRNDWVTTLPEGWEERHWESVEREDVRVVRRRVLVAGDRESDFLLMAW